MPPWPSILWVVIVILAVLLILFLLGVINLDPIGN